MVNLKLNGRDRLFLSSLVVFQQEILQLHSNLNGHCTISTLCKNGQDVGFKIKYER
jgi:hypothetical protein